jgi:hypothetical protein
MPIARRDGSAQSEPKLTLDSQQVEILGRNRIKAALIEAGIEVATPERDNGIDLIAYRWSLAGEFRARPIQIKAASDFSFGIDRKYERIPGLIMVFIMASRDEDHRIFALTYSELLAMADTLGWTRTPSWIAGAYSTRHASKRLMKILDGYAMTRESWARFFSHVQASAA